MKKIIFSLLLLIEWSYLFANEKQVQEKNVQELGKKTFSKSISANIYVDPQYFLMNGFQLGVDFFLKENIGIGAFIGTSRPFAMSINGKLRLKEDRINRVAIKGLYRFSNKLNSSFFVTSYLGHQVTKVKEPTSLVSSRSSTIKQNMTDKSFFGGVTGGYQWIFNGGINLSLAAGGEIFNKKVPVMKNNKSFRADVNIGYLF